MMAFFWGAPDPVAPVLLALATVLAAAKLGGHFAERAGQPAVLGELLAGVVLGNLPGTPWLHGLSGDPVLDILARIGVVILLFEVGLGSTIRDMMQVGVRSLVTAVAGVVAPWILGWGVGVLLLPGQSSYVHVFLGAILTATSVGITARVLRDLGRSSTKEARIILGAAVIDDVLGLVILAVVAGAITAGDQEAGASAWAVGLIILKAVLFLFGALTLGARLSLPVFQASGLLRGSGVLLATALIFCFVLSYLASAIGLAPIVGAYAAGLILEHAHYVPFAGRSERQLEELIQPVSTFLVPVFFVLMGMRVDVSALLRPEVAGLAAALTVVAIAGKQICAIGGWGPGLDRLTIGIGMIPRGEVGLIFASLGEGLTVHGERIVDEGTYSAVVIMVMVTTLVTPPALKWSLQRRERALARQAASAG